jgi:hypothetical protein
MPTGDDYTVAVVLINRHEPEGETTGRLIELAEEKGYDSRVVEAQRGEHDVALSWRVPEDVAEAFNAERADRWPEDAEKPDAAAVNEDAYAADGNREAVADPAAHEEDTTHPARRARPGKARE